MVDFGVGLFGTEPPQELVELSCLSEELGYDNVWIGDSQLIWRESYVTMGAIARETEKVVIGTGVTNVVTRHPSVLASAWTTLSELSGGRVILGVGAGDSSLRTMGLKPVKLAELEEQVNILRGLMAGEEVQLSSGKARLTFGGTQDIPIYIAASSPKILELSGRIADGVVMLVGTNPKFIEAGLERIHKGAKSAGRNPEDVKVILWTPTSILSDPTKARDVVRAHVARVVIRRLPTELEPEKMERIKKIRDTYDYYNHMDVEADHGDLVQDDLVNDFALAGTLDEARDQLKSILTVKGLSQIAIIPYVPLGGDRSNVIQDFAKLMAEVRGSEKSALL